MVANQVQKAQPMKNSKNCERLVRSKPKFSVSCFWATLWLLFLEIANFPILDQNVFYAEHNFRQANDLPSFPEIHAYVHHARLK